MKPNKSEKALKLAMIWLNTVAEMKCYCNDKHPCPSAVALEGIVAVEDLLKTFNRKKERK